MNPTATQHRAPISRLRRAAALLATALLVWWGGSTRADAATPEPRPASEYGAEALLLKGLTACAAVIDLRDASLPARELGQLYMGLLHRHPELFHVAPRLSYGYRDVPSVGGTVRLVTEVYPAYTLVGEDLTVARTLYRDTVAGILTEMEAAFGGYPYTEAEKVLYLHDLLADRYAYDTRGEEASAPQGGNADAYTFFRDGKGVCQAYALAFLALCEGAGLEAHLVVSDAMNHAWNHVRVDGVWYHVDVTRDDPIPAEGGSPRVNHTRLLRSDRGMDSLGYRGYTCAVGHTCTDTRFESPDGGAALQIFPQKLRFWGGKWLGVDENGGVVAVKIQNNGIFAGEVGDADLDGSVTPADLLALYDPAFPEAWRVWMRDALTKGT